jgi:hypothetical protein
LARLAAAPVKDVRNDPPGGVLDGPGPRQLAPQHGLELGRDREGERAALFVLRGPWFEPHDALLEVRLPPLKRQHFPDPPAGQRRKLDDRPRTVGELRQNRPKLRLLEEAGADVILLKHRDGWHVGHDPGLPPEPAYEAPAEPG